MKKLTMAFCFTMLTFSHMSTAALIEKFFNTVITQSSDLSLYGHVVSWSMSYDDSLSAASVYSDGSNGQGEFGAGDDILLDTINAFPGEFISNAVFDLSGFSALINSVINPELKMDVNDINLSFAEGSDDAIAGLVIQDSVFFSYTNTSGPVFNQTIMTDFGPTQFFLAGEGDTILDGGGLPILPVMEPGTIWMLLFGILILLNLNKRKRQK